MSLVGDVISRFRTKRSADDASDRDENNDTLQANSSYAEYVAPACHYNEDTLLNKGGELVQVIEIEKYAPGTGGVALQDAIRESISRVGDPDIAFWIYTVRRRQKFNLEWKKTGDFSDTLHERYMSHVESKYDTYANKIYVAVVSKHLAEGVNSIVGALLFRNVIKRHKSYLSSKAAYLSQVTEDVISHIGGATARRLGLIRCKDSRWRSELLEFLSYLVTFNNRECYLETCDNEHTISSGCDLQFGFNTLKISNGAQVKYGAILGIKTFLSDPFSVVDTCLQQECEFIITEIVRFIEGKQVKESYCRQAEMLDISGDGDLSKMGDLHNVMELEDGAYGECCEKLVNCVVVADDQCSLKRGVMRMVEAFSVVGAIVVRSDIAMEDNFWSMLPGNFRYALGMKPALIKWTCMLVALQEFQTTSLKDRGWMGASAMFFSTRGLPHFFSFSAVKGHTVCLGPPESAMTMLLNFLLSESRRLGVKSVVFDYSGKSVIYANAIGGQYHRVDDRPERVSSSFNPFNVKDSERNRKVAAEVLYRMISPGTEPDDVLKQSVDEAVGRIFAIHQKKRTLDKISECVRDLGGRIAHWISGGKFSHLICNETDIKWDAEFLAINAGMLVGKLECLSSLLYYLLSAMEENLDGSPVILVMYESWILDVVFYTEEGFDAWVERMSSLNVIIVFAGEDIRAISSSKVIRYVGKHTGTRIFMPNFMVSSKQHGRMFGLSQGEIDTMLQISQSEGHFFLKQGESSVVLSLQLPEQVSRVLSANRATIKIMYEAQAEKGSDWLEAFHEKCDTTL
ncbi:type IV secretion system protein, virB4 family [Anaplasma platys]|uniref:Type IV secretion system protein, virB4 family n=1 Tax=Anaplasma platys TaxID=949 RepID=A0A858PZ91_9RICK|nr:hypothetical protein [Anaplasma platys]QJC27899.1 type IV secretion system protein, virB4 family [Anaplasma platys]